MKALVILNTILEDEEYEDMECVASGFTKTYFEKAISELEALQQHVEELESKPNCCTYHIDNLPILNKCGHCDYIECSHHQKDHQ